MYSNVMLDNFGCSNIIVIFFSLLYVVYFFLYKIYNLIFIVLFLKFVKIKDSWCIYLIIYN